MKRIWTAAGLVAFSLSTLSGCAFFDNEARDRAACDKLSQVITQQEVDNLATDVTSDFMNSLESEVLPLASGALGTQIRDLLDSYESLSEESIFDRFAGGVDGLVYAEAILVRCVEVSSDLF